MKRMIGAAAICCLVAVGAAGAARGASNTLSGTSIGDPNNTISMKVTVKNGVAKSVSGLKTVNYDYACDDETTTGESTYAVPGSLKVKKVDGNYAFGGNSAAGQYPYWRASGTINKKGTSATVEVYYAFEDGGFRCGGTSGAQLKK